MASAPDSRDRQRYHREYMRQWRRANRLQPVGHWVYHALERTLTQTAAPAGPLPSACPKCAGLVHLETRTQWHCVNCGKVGWIGSIGAMVHDDGLGLHASHVDVMTDIPHRARTGVAYVTGR